MHGYRRLFKSNTNAVFAGVCGGIGEYFGIDPVIIRLIFAVVAFMSCGTAILIYLIAMFVIPAQR